MSIIGPGGCGKTKLVSQIIFNQTIIFTPCFENIVYFYKQFQSDYKPLSLGCTKEKLPIEFHQGLQWAAVDRSEARNRKAMKISYWRPVSGCLWKWNVSQLGCFWKTSKYTSNDFDTIKLPARQKFKNDWSQHTLINLFKSPRDVEQIGVLGRILGDRKLLLEAYEGATRKHFGHLLIDLEPQTDQKLKYCSNCSGSKPRVFLTLQLCQTWYWMLSQRDFYTPEFFSKIEAILEQSFLLHCPTQLNKFFCNCLFNVVHGAIRMTANVSVKKLKRHQSNIETLL